MDLDELYIAKQAPTPQLDNSVGSAIKPNIPL